MTGSRAAGISNAVADEVGDVGEVGERQVPFYCPYCGEEELRPGGAKAGHWRCRACARTFQLRFTGVVS